MLMWGGAHLRPQLHYLREQRQCSPRLALGPVKKAFSKERTWCVVLILTRMKAAISLFSEAPFKRPVELDGAWTRV
jgi:hypothetical protein